MEKNKTLRIGFVCGVIALITICALCGTFAKYVSGGSGQDNARVAKWGVSYPSNTPLKLFSEAYSYNDSSAASTPDDRDVSNTVASDTTGDKVVAPGTQNQINLNLATFNGAAPEVAYKYICKMDVLTAPKDTIWELDNNPAFHWQIKLPTDNTIQTFNTFAEFKGWFESMSKSWVAPNTYPDGGHHEGANTCILGWKWDFEADGQDNKLDSHLGNMAANGELQKFTININLTAEQIQQNNPFGKTNVKFEVEGEGTVSQNTAQVPYNTQFTTTTEDGEACFILGQQGNSNSAKIIAKPGDTDVFDSWVVNGIEYGTGNVGEVDNLTVIAKFKKASPTSIGFIVDDPTHGSISPEGALDTYVGAKYTVDADNKLVVNGDASTARTATPNDGFKFIKWMISEDGGDNFTDIPDSADARVISTTSVVFKACFAIPLSKPSQDGELTYTGKEQTPNWKNYTPGGHITLDIIAQKNVRRDYKAKFTLDAGYSWDDGTTDPYNVEWSINSLNLSECVIAFGSGESDEYEFTLVDSKPVTYKNTLGLLKHGDNEIVLQSSDATIVETEAFNPGTYNVSIESKDDQSNCTGSVSKPWHINGYYALDSNTTNERKLIFQYGHGDGQSTIYPMYIVEKARVVNDAVVDIPWSADKDKFTEVVFEESFAKYKPSQCLGWFEGFSSLSNIDGLQYLDCSEIKGTNGMQYMFAGLNTIEALDLTALNQNSHTTSSCQCFKAMFKNSQSLKNINVSNLNLSSATDLSSMFYGCSSLEAIDLSICGTINPSANLISCFESCASLQKVLVPIETNWSAFTQSTDIFKNCNSLIGGVGTKASDIPDMSARYAKVDGGENDPGLFTTKVNITHTGNPEKATVSAEDISNLEQGTYTVSEEGKKISFSKASDKNYVITPDTGYSSAWSLDGTNKLQDGTYTITSSLNFIAMSSTANQHTITFNQLGGLIQHPTVSKTYRHEGTGYTVVYDASDQSYTCDANEGADDLNVDIPDAKMQLKNNTTYQLSLKYEFVDAKPSDYPNSNVMIYYHSTETGASPSEIAKFENKTDDPKTITVPIKPNQGDREYTFRIDTNFAPKIKITEMYITNDGIQDQKDDIKATYDQALPDISKRPPLPLKNGNKGFLGWYDSPTGGTQYYKPCGLPSLEKFNVVDDEVTLYPHWIDNKITPKDGTIKNPDGNLSSTYNPNANNYFLNLLNDNDPNVNDPATLDFNAGTKYYFHASFYSDAACTQLITDNGSFEIFFRDPNWVDSSGKERKIHFSDGYLTDSTAELLSYTTNSPKSSNFILRFDNDFHKSIYVANLWANTSQSLVSEDGYEVEETNPIGELFTSIGNGISNLFAKE